jgi:hypothetical protein
MDEYSRGIQSIVNRIRDDGIITTDLQAKCYLANFYDEMYCTICQHNGECVRQHEKEVM